MTEPSVVIVIVGGGLAGLCVARRLHQAGTAFRLYEARARLGGRILTVDADGQSSVDGFDLGPSWVWPAIQPALAALISELGLSTYPQFRSGDGLFERTAQETPVRVPGLADDGLSLRIVGGTAALVTALAAQLPPEQLTVNAPVRTLARTNHGVAVSVEAPDVHPYTVNASKVVLAAPPRLLASMLDFIPLETPETLDRWRRTPTWMAASAKFLAIYPRPFWRSAGLSGTAQSLAGPLGEIHDASTASGAYALFGFLSLSAEARSRLGVSAVQQACLDQLMRLFGSMAADPLAVHLQDWTAEPWTATAADRVLAGHPVPAVAPWSSTSWSDRLILAGSEASPTDPGYLHGAVVAAEHAARRAITR